jgi:ATP-binding cassette, subfamily B (MDR/TAP), member 1
MSGSEPAPYDRVASSASVESDTTVSSPTQPGPAAAANNTNSSGASAPGYDRLASGASSTGSVEVKGDDIELQVTDPVIEEETADSVDSETEDSDSVEEPKELTAKKQHDKKVAEDMALAKTLPFSKLFRFAGRQDYILMAIGTLGSMINGMVFPAFSVIFGDMLNNFNLNRDQLKDEVIKNSYAFIVLAFVTFTASIMALGAWSYTAERQTKKLRIQYFSRILGQDNYYMDDKDPGLISNQLTEDSAAFLAGTGEKISTCIHHLTTVFGGIGVGMYYGWQVALLVLAVMPVMGAAFGLVAYAHGTYSQFIASAYSSAGSVASETFGAIGTVTAFTSIGRETVRYKDNLKEAYRYGVKKALLNGVAMGSVAMTMMTSYGMVLWFGSFLIRERYQSPRTNSAYDGGEIMTVFFSVLIGAMSLGQAGGSLSAIMTAKAAAVRAFSVIDSEVVIPPDDPDALKPEKLEGVIEFENVHFHYPTRDDVQIFQNFNLSIKPGSTVALVGESGSGKSTVIRLLQRFYDPVDGRIVVDGNNLRDINVRWWRSNVGVVSQEPVLFSGTVYDNIRFGDQDATDRHCELAAKAANAHEFIRELPGGYNSDVTSSSLSGGQKQRIAIARAILTNPPLLLLDEATSALDNESERAVQNALDKLMSTRTTVVVAHRLTTIMKADMIHVVREGRIVESGTHSELLANSQGAYSALVKIQQMAQDRVDDNAIVDTVEAAVDLDEKTSTLESDLVTVANDIKRQHSASLSVPSRQSRAISVGSANSKNGKASKDEEDEPEKEEELKEEFPHVPWSRGYPFLAGNNGWLVLGTVGAMFQGALNPLWALLFGDMVGVLYETDEETQKDDSARLALYFFLLGLGLFGSWIAQHAGFGVVGERMTRRIRVKSYNHILRQEMAFFDDPHHSSHIMASRIAEDATMVRAGITDRAGLTIQIISAIVCAMVIAFIKSWQLALLVLGLMPVLAASSGMYMKFMFGMSAASRKAYEAAANIAGEAISNLQTLVSFNAQPFILERYTIEADVPVVIARRASIISGASFGVGQMMIFLVYALCFYVGAVLIEKDELTFDNMLQAIFALVIAGMNSGQSAQMAPDFVKAAISRDNIFGLLDREPKIDAASTDGKDCDVDEQGTIRFEDIEFAYPTRPDNKVLNSASLNVPAGSVVALVGSSGSGKTTLMSLLMRFYDPDGGRVLLDGVDIRDFKVQQLRQQMSIVGQEPVLFNMSIADNIRYGNPDATQAEIEAAALAANIHDVVMGLPKKYATSVGARGSKLSGGQKQRVAIARALVRNPKVLLLDEATSALDSESEKVVQDALDKIMHDHSRTVFVIAHRLSTVKNADIIAVMDAGEVVEIGNHDELLSKNGVYAALIRAGK